MTAKTAKGRELCRLNDIPEDGSAGFVIERDGKKEAVLALRRGDDVYVYVNSCPHIGSPLDFTPGQFLDVENIHVLCSSHGALFRIADGQCISGPCQGETLKAVPVRLEGERVVLVE